MAFRQFPASHYVAQAFQPAGSGDIPVPSSSFVPGIYRLHPNEGVRPVYHQKMERIEAHILGAFLSHTLHVCLRQRLKAVAGGLTPRAVLEKFCAGQMVDVHLPTTDGRKVILTWHTQPEKELQVLLTQLKLTLPAQPPPKITAARAV